MLHADGKSLAEVNTTAYCCYDEYHIVKNCLLDFHQIRNLNSEHKSSKATSKEVFFFWGNEQNFRSSRLMVLFLVENTKKGLYGIDGVLIKE